MFLVTIVLLLLTMSNMLFAQSKSSEFKITVSDDAGSAPAVMMFGNHVDGTYGATLAQLDSLNPTIVERESPPLPPGLGVVWKPARAGMNWGIGLMTYDFRGYTSETQIDTFKISFVNGDSYADITLEWPDATYLGLRCTGMTIKIGTDIIDMFAQTSYTIVDAGEIPINSATITKTGCFIIDDVKLEKSTVPAGYKLNQNFPNPFNPSTTITFDVLKSSNIDVSVYNVLGQKVASLVSRDLNPGTYSTNWNAASYSSGVYYVRMTAKENGVEQYSSLHKMLFVK